MSLNSHKSKLSGLIPPIITPLTSAGDVDIDGLKRLINYLVDHHVSGVFVLGSSGEGPWLTSSQKEQVIRTAVEAADGRILVLAGALEPSTGRTLEVIELAASAGANYAVITSPYYFEADPACQIRHFTQISQSTPIPALIYNIPGMTHNPIMASTIGEVVDQPQIVGVKDSAGDMENFAAVLNLKEKRPDLAVFQGAEKLSIEALAMGADGLVTGLGNIVPNFFYDMIGHAENNNQDDARKIQDQVNELWKLHTYGYWLVCLKYAASLLGFGSGTTIDRDHTLSPEARASIKHLVESYTQ